MKMERPVKGIFELQSNKLCHDEMLVCCFSIKNCVSMLFQKIVAYGIRKYANFTPNDA